ncbi:MAG: hypothetical protein OEY79_04475, partial [Anaplasmataceae bacterium]|nr:hypothetical protein [Anaplasmataceae bacterium]
KLDHKIETLKLKLKLDHAMQSRPNSPNRNTPSITKPIDRSQKPKDKLSDLRSELTKKEPIISVLPFTITAIREEECTIILPGNRVPGNKEIKTIIRVEYQQSLHFSEDEDCIKIIEIARKPIIPRDELNWSRRGIILSTDEEIEEMLKAKSISSLYEEKIENEKCTIKLQNGAEFTEKLLVIKSQISERREDGCTTRIPRYLLLEPLAINVEEQLGTLPEIPTH